MCLRALRFVLPAVAVAIAAAPACGDPASSSTISGPASSSTIRQSIPPDLPASPKLPPLNLSDRQKARIQQVLTGQHNEVEFQLKTTKSAKSFVPAIGASIPKGLKPQAFPRPLTTEIPQTRPYAYLKLKDQILIVDLMTHKIVEMFPERS